MTSFRSTASSSISHLSTRPRKTESKGFASKNGIFTIIRYSRQWIPVFVQDILCQRTRATPVCILKPKNFVRVKRDNGMLRESPVSKYVFADISTSAVTRTGNRVLGGSSINMTNTFRNQENLIPFISKTIDTIFSPSYYLFRNWTFHREEDEGEEI